MCNEYCEIGQHDPCIDNVLDVIGDAAVSSVSYILLIISININLKKESIELAKAQPMVNAKANNEENESMSFNE